MGTLQEWKQLRTDALLGNQAVGAPLLRLGFCKVSSVSYKRVIFSCVVVISCMFHHTRTRSQKKKKGREVLISLGKDMVRCTHEANSFKLLEFDRLISAEMWCRLMWCDLYGWN
jgi:hypothetical protein